AACSPQILPWRSPGCDALAAVRARRFLSPPLKRAVIIDLVEHLPVSLVEPLRDHRHEMGVGERPPRHPAFGDLSTPRMAKPAGLDFFAQLSRRNASHRKAGFCIVPPSHARTLVE